MTRIFDAIRECRTTFAAQDSRLYLSGDPVVKLHGHKPVGEQLHGFDYARFILLQQLPVGAG